MLIAFYQQGYNPACQDSKIGGGGDLMLGGGWQLTLAIHTHIIGVMPLYLPTDL